MTEAESQQLVELMYKVRLPAPRPVFEAWCQVFGTIPVEVVVMRAGGNGPEVFLLHRADKFFTGWHLPGCVHLPSESVTTTLERVLETEVEMPVTKPEFFDWFERLGGSHYGQSPRGHELSLVYLVKLSGDVKEGAAAKFFPLTAIPKDLITNQDPIIKKLLEKYGPKS